MEEEQGAEKTKPPPRWSQEDERVMSEGRQEHTFWLMAIDGVAPAGVRRGMEPPAANCGCWPATPCEAATDHPLTLAEPLRTLRAVEPLCTLCVSTLPLCTLRDSRPPLCVCVATTPTPIGAYNCAGTPPWPGPSALAPCGLSTAAAARTCSVTASGVHWPTPRDAAVNADSVAPGTAGGATAAACAAAADGDREVDLEADPSEDTALRLLQLSYSRWLSSVSALLEAPGHERSLAEPAVVRLLEAERHCEVRRKGSLDFMHAATGLPFPPPLPPLAPSSTMGVEGL
jgi:hypothetical protein